MGPGGASKPIHQQQLLAGAAEPPATVSRSVVSLVAVSLCARNCALTLGNGSAIGIALPQATCPSVPRATTSLADNVSRVARIRICIRFTYMYAFVPICRVHDTPAYRRPLLCPPRPSHKYLRCPNGATTHFTFRSRLSSFVIRVQIVEDLPTMH